MAGKYYVGDEAELGPILMTRFISDVVAEGGRVTIKGNVAKVVYMPPQKSGPMSKAEKAKPVLTTKAQPRRST